MGKTHKFSSKINNNCLKSSIYKQHAIIGKQFWNNASLDQSDFFSTFSELLDASIPAINNFNSSLGFGTFGSSDRKSLKKSAVFPLTIFILMSAMQ